MPEPLPEPAASQPSWAERLERWRATLPRSTPTVAATGAVVAAVVVAAVVVLGSRSTPAPLVLPRAAPGPSAVPTTAAADATVAVHAA
ncbi:MAG TPA: hypothetical protein VHH09_02535, partial [Acidimicrobiales bacterium]|nr:hypothetical protein [Acidimicrobiales bacterium]